MSLEVAGCSRIQSSLEIRIFNQDSLGLAIRLCDARCPTILIGPGGADNCADSVTITDGILHRLDNDSSHSLASTVSIRALVESKTSVVRGKNTQIVKSVAEFPSKYQVGTDDETLRRICC